MPGNEIGDLDLLLHLARALPTGRSLRIRLLSLVDAELSDRLARLRREQGCFAADVRPGLLRRLRRRLSRFPAGAAAVRAAAPGTRPARPGGPAAAARRAWAHARKGVELGLAGRKAVYLWVALSTLTIAVLLLSPLQGGSGIAGFGMPAPDGEERYVRPPLIVGY